MVAAAVDFSPTYATGVLAEDYQTVQQDFLLYPYCSIFTDDVENGNQGWTPQYPWAITTLFSHSPSHSWTDSPGGNYGNYLDISLTSQSFDFSGYTGISLDFWHKYMTEADWDFANVEYNSGTGWKSVATYDGFHNSWTQENIQIPQLDGQANGQIRFHFTTDTNTVYDGWYVDDISIIGGGPGCVSLYPPDAEFTSNSPVELGQAIQYTNLSTGTDPLTYTWNFGDGSGPSTETNPSHTYSYPGIYPVTLEAYNPYGTDSIIHTVEVQDVPVVYRNLLPMVTK
jgi:PKD repeat protein